LTEYTHPVTGMKSCMPPDPDTRTPFLQPLPERAMPIVMYLARMKFFPIIRNQPIIRQMGQKKSWPNFMPNLALNGR